MASPVQLLQGAAPRKGLGRADLLIALAAIVLALAATRLTYATSPYVPLIMGAAVAATVIVALRPMTGLYVAIALIPLEFVSLPIGVSAVSPAEGMMVLTGVTWLITTVANGERPYSHTPLNLPILVLLLLVATGIAVAPDPGLVIKTLVLWTCFFFVYLMISTDATTDNVRTILLVLALSAGALGMFAVVQGGEQELIGYGDVATGRAAGPFGSPNELASFEALALPGAVALALAGWRLQRPLGFAAFGLILVGTALSLSRGGMLAISGTLLVMLFWRPFRMVALSVSVVVITLATLGGVSIGENEHISRVTERAESVSYSAEGADYRLYIWDRAPAVVADNPLFGVGMNAFSVVAPQYGLVGYNGTRVFLHAHNIPLTVAVELGLLGLAALAWACVALARTLRQAYRCSDGGDRAFAIALTAAFAGLALHGLVDYTFRLNAIVTIVFVLSGCAVALARANSEARPSLR